MKTLVKWAISNTPGMNVLLLGIVVLGIYCFSAMRREMLPQFDMEVVTISVPYPGANPEEVEEGICQKIEEEVQGLEGVRKMTSCAAEGLGIVTLELETYIKDPQKTLGEVRNAVDRISSFPLLAENRTIALETIRSHAFMIGVMAPADIPDEEFYANLENELLLRETAENLRRALLRHPEFRKIDIGGIRDYQIDVEISEQKLREYDLTLQEVAGILRRRNIEIPGGMIRTESEEVLLRGKARKNEGTEIAEIPLLTTPDGLVLRVRDLGHVRDGFLDTTMIQKINGRPGIVLTISKTQSEDMLALCESARKFVREEAPGLMPDGYEVITVADMSDDIGQVIAVLLENGWQGMLIVFICLALFLDLKLAAWVALGIPIAMLGAGCVLFGMDETMNMMSIFAFIMVLGILVDDGIIIGESIYHHREQGKDFARAAVEGTAEVAPSVVSSVTTTCIAFAPLLFLPGMVGKFTAIVPAAVIVTLLFSLFDSLFLLPVHLSHDSRRTEHDKETETPAGPLRRGVRRVVGFFRYPFSLIYDFSRRCNEIVARLTQRFIETVYAPVLRFFLGRPLLFLALMACLLLSAVGMVLGGHVKFTAFPEEDSFIVYADITFPDGTPAAETMKAVQKIESAAAALDEESMAAQKGKLREIVVSSVGNIDEDSPLGGSNLGRVMICLTPIFERKSSSMEILGAWRERTGEIPGVEILKFAGFDGSPGGEMVEFKLLAAPEDMPALESAVEEIKRKLETYDGVYDVASDLRPGKFEYRISVKEDALALGITNAELLDRIRPAYYGEEVMRLQRGRHEVKLMVRYPEEERNRLGSFDEIKYRPDSPLHRAGNRDGEPLEIPMGELAEVEVGRGYSAINRSGQLRAVTITASADSHKADVTQIVEKLRTRFVPELLARPEYRNIDVRWEGQFESASETISTLGFGCLAAFLVIFTLLAFQFKSYIRPLTVMFIIPLSLAGAVFGHYLMGLDLTLMSFLGLVALAGVVTNDSIVLVDCAARLSRCGMPKEEALVACGKRRFRAVFLTSITTIGGISPLMFENSFHTQVLVPLAVSLSFGLMFSTVLVLLMVPVLLSLGNSKEINPVIPVPDRSRGQATAGT